jgi:ribosomal-protein-alanine N-acetyltransferase
MSAEVRIERLGASDVEAIATVDEAAFLAAGVGEGRTRETRIASLHEELANGWSRLWGVRVGDALVAVLVAWHVADELHILDVATHPAAQRRGHGARLIAHALAYAKEHRLRMLLLEVRRSNTPAIGLYRRFHFHTLNLRRGYYQDGEDAVEMALLLDPETFEPRPSEDEVRLSSPPG